MRSIKKGTTSQSLYFEFLDTTSTTGGRKTGLAFNTASLTAYYVRNQGSATAITLATLAAANSAWSSGGFKEVDATNMPGLYRLDVPDAAFATGADSVVITVKGATGMAQASLEIALIDNNSADVMSRLGAPAGASVSADVAAVKTDTAAIKTKTDSLTFTVAGMVDSNVVDWKGAAAPAMTGDAYARLGAPAGASVSADVAAVKSDSGGIKTKTDSLTFTVAGMVDSNVVDWKGSAAPAMTGDAYARLGAPAGASVSADVAAVKTDTAAVKAKTDNLPASPAAVGSAMTLTAAYDAAKTAASQTSVDDLPTNAELTTALAGADDATLAAIAALPTAATVNAIKAKTDNLPASPAATGDAMTLTGAYDAAKTAASQTSVDDLPTNAELATALAGADDATLAAIAALPTAVTVSAIKAKTDNLPPDPADASDIAAAFGTVATAFAALPTAATVNAIKAKTDNLPGSPAATGDAMTLTGAYDAAKTAATQASVDDLPTNAELATALAGADDATLAAIAALPVTAIKAKTDLIPGTIDGKSFAEHVTLQSAVLLGKASGLGTATARFRSLDDAKDRVVATVDESGNRSAVTLDAG